ncbi:hypothetical protein [Cupriavidus sp. 8B]
MSAKYFAYRGFEIIAFAQRNVTGLWVGAYEAFATDERDAIDLETVLSCRFLCDGVDHKLASDEDEAAEEAAAWARAVIEARLIVASLRRPQG